MALLQLVAGQGGDSHRVLLHQVCELGVAQGPVVEVGPQGEHHADRRLRVGDGGRQPSQEAAADGLVVAQGEQLLELVDHHQQLGGVVGKNPANPADDPPASGRELLQQRGRGVDRHPQQRRLELLEGTGAGVHRRHEPLVGSGHRASAQRRHQAGPHHRRLARPRRTHDRQQPVAGSLTVHAGDQLVDQALPAEEVVSVALVEGTQPLVRVLHPGADDGQLPLTTRMLGLDRRQHLAEIECAGGECERVDELADVLVALGRVLSRGPLQHVVDGGDDVRMVIADSRYRLVELPVQCSGRVGAVAERQLGGQGLVGGDRQPVDVGRRSGRFLPELLGRCIGRRSW